jgi:thioredoxin-like negative regulator of GroEL
MDCRAIRSRHGTRETTGRTSFTWRWVGRLSLVLCPILFFGCTPQGMFPIANPSSRSDTPPPLPDDQPILPKRMPKPQTCVKAGELLEATAESPKRSGQEKAQLLENTRIAYQQALREDPANADAARDLARLYLKQGDQDRAVALLQQVLQKRPKDAGLWFDLAMCQARHKDFEPALRNLRQAVVLDPDNRTYATSYGHLLARAGHYDESVAQFTKLLGPAMAYYQVARMQEHVQQIDLARANLQQALHLNPKLEPAQQLLAALDNGGPVPASPEPSGAVPVSFEEQ